MKFKLFVVIIFSITLSLLSPLHNQATMSSPAHPRTNFSTVYSLWIRREPFQASTASIQYPTSSKTVQSALQPSKARIQQPVAKVEFSEDASIQEAINDLRLLEFIESVMDDTREEWIVGAYSPGVLASPVVQQPSNNPIYVSPKEKTLTQFRRANQIGSIGLLAHNYLAGRFFFNLKNGSEITLVYGDGSYQGYRVYEIQDYQALSLYTYRHIETQTVIDQYDLFDLIYTGNHDKLVLQTCIKKDGASSWGRRFILAEKISGSLSNDDGGMGAAGIGRDDLAIFGQ